MPLKNGHLTVKERAFSAFMARTGDATYSAEKAGYAAPAVRGSELKRRPAVQAETARLYRQKMFDEGLPAAYQAHIEILMDAKTPAGARAVAVKEMYAQTLGHLADEAADKDPSEMTLDEIIKRSEALQRERANRALDVTPEPEEPQESSVFD